jgi:pyruvate formate-lyase activating enzyme-like uncharacterized protein
LHALGIELARYMNVNELNVNELNVNELNVNER